MPSDPSRIDAAVRRGDRPALVPVWAGLARRYADGRLGPGGAVSFRGLMPANRAALAELVGLAAWPDHACTVTVSQLAAGLGVETEDMPVVVNRLRQRALATARLEPITVAH